MVKEFLSQRGIGFEERDVSRDRNAAQELISKTGQMGVPVTVIDGQTVIGFDQRRFEQILAQRKPRKFGASIADASIITAKQGSGITLGAYIGSVKPGSVAEKVGLLAGDIIIEFNMRPIANATDLDHVLSNINTGSRFSLVVLRGNNKMTTEGAF